MCSPMLVGGVMMAGSAISAYGQYQAQDAQLDQARNNAVMADNQASDAITRGALAEEQQLARTRQMLGTQRAAIGASGVEASGSAGRLLDDTAAIGAADAMTIRNNAAREAWGFRVETNNFRNQARMLKSQKRMTVLTGLTGSASSGLRGYSSAGGSFGG